jgi:isoquinoline 1-oxidoreductase alpha subunit
MILNINNQDYEISEQGGTILLWILRDELGLTGVKFGCGAGICGSCTVHIDGVATRACITSVDFAEGKAIRTIEGLASGETLHPVQQAFLDLQTPQCGWCMPGQMMTAAALLSENGNPSEAEIDEAMNRNYCRCGTYARIREAVQVAARLEQEG